MTNPLSPKSDDENLDKQKESKEQPDSAGLTLGDFMPMDKKEFGAKTPLEKDTTPKGAREIGSLRPAFTYTFGQLPAFQLRKSEFRHEIEKSMAEVKPLVDQFLKETPEREDESLSPAEKNELKQTRESLSQSSTSADALSKSLHLARLYQHIRYLEEAKKATDLSLGIDPDNHVGREMFKELERLHPPDIAVVSRRTTTAELTKSNLRNRIQKLSGGTVIVVGDLLIDELLEGKPERISREAPVLILEHVDTELIPGGAANTANNIASLGGRCHAVGVCGRDEYADKLAGLFDKAGIAHSLVKDPSRPTTVKTRILSKSHSFRQQLLRLDRISHQEISAVVESLLTDKLTQVAGQYKAIVLSDYKGGVVTDAIIAHCRALADSHKLMIVVDAQDRLERFQNVTLLTPNQPDTEKMVGFPIDSRETLEKAGQELMLLTGAKALLITRGSHGMALFEENKDLLELPVFNKSEVFDVTGAGDTVVATMALALTTGCSFLEAMALGNLAAGIVVRKQGTAVTSQKEMLENLELLQLEE